MIKSGAAFLAALAFLTGLTPVQDDFTSAEKEFRAALQGQAPKPLEDAIRKLVKINTPAAAKLILGGIRGNNDIGIYWMLVNGAASFGSHDALQEVTRIILANKASAIARDLVAALHGNFTAGVEGALLAILREGPVDLQVLAVEHLMDIGQKPSVEAALEMLKKGAGSPDLTRRLFRVLNVLCAESYGETLSNWEGWWNANKHKDWNLLRAKPSDGLGASTGTVCDNLGKHRDSEYEKLKTGKILVIGSKTGCKCKYGHDFDNMEVTAQRMKIPVEYVNKTDFSKESFKLDDYIAILGNCTQLEEHCMCEKCMKATGEAAGNRLKRCPNCSCGHKSAKYVMPPAGLDKIRKYVEEGGYLFTEDWAMKDILAQRFKEFVDQGPFMTEMEVNIAPKAGAGSHPYLRNIFSRLKPRKQYKPDETVASESPDFERIDHIWKIDNESPAIKIVNKSKVTVLIFSKDIGKASGDKGSDAVAVTFTVGPKGQPGTDPVGTGAPIEQDRTKMTGGRVLHVMSHFGKQKSQTDEYTIQNLLLNFLIEASERRGMKVEKK